MSTSTQSQPSSILFFIAVAIGVLIAVVFIFFSLRYYVRTKLGIYATARITTTTNNGIVLLTGDFAMQTFNSYNPDLNAHLRRARRRRRYTKKRRLTEEEVDHLFPVRTYQNWLDGGAEKDADDRAIHEMLKEENDELMTEENNEMTEENNEIAQGQNQTQESNEDKGEEEKVDGLKKQEIIDEAKDEASSSPKPELDLGNPFNDDLHYDSGSCAICIDTFEPNDMVRGLICGHVFHQECLDPWLIKRKACCPMCKRDYYLKKPNEEGREENDNENADLESVNNYTELHYTTLADRVQEILERNPEIEAIAKDRTKHYFTLKWRLFWIIMGISKTELLNSAIVSEDQRQREAERANETAATATTETNTETNTESNEINETNESETNADTNEPQAAVEEQSPAEANANRDRVETMV